MCSAGDNNFPVPGTADNVVTFLGIELARQSALNAPLFSIRRSPEVPTADPLVRGDYIFLADGASGSSGFFTNIPIVVEGGETLVLNSTTPLYAILFFNVS